LIVALLTLASGLLALPVLIPYVTFSPLVYPLTALLGLILAPVRLAPTILMIVIGLALALPVIIIVGPVHAYLVRVRTFKVPTACGFHTNGANLTKASVSLPVLGVVAYTPTALTDTVSVPGMGAPTILTARVLLTRGIFSVARVGGVGVRWAPASILHAYPAALASLAIRAGSIGPFVGHTEPGVHPFGVRLLIAYTPTRLLVAHPAIP
jgi:hypothetical protein